jgi:hypothetical protein|nr:MAG TPA: hypothetical protein [Caudoviricetes sp.]
MIYNTEEIRLTAEEYVRCIELFYTLKDRGGVYGYDTKINSIEEECIEFCDDGCLVFSLSEGIVEQFEMLSNMTIKSVLDKLRFIMTHAIYSLYEVQELLKQNKTAYRLCPNFTLNAYLEGNVFKNVLNYLLECNRLYNYFVDGDYFNCCIRYVHEDVKNPFHMYNNKGEDVPMLSPVIQHVAFTPNKEIAVHEVMENIHAVMFMLSKLHLDKLKLLRKTYQDALELNSNWHTRVKYNDNRDVGLINTLYINLPKEIKSTDVEHIDTVRLVKDVVDAITVGVSCNYSCEKDKITVFDIISAMVCHSDTLLRDTYGDGYTNYDATTKVFLDKMGCINLNKHISQAMMLYIIYYYRYKIKNDTYLRLERLKHALEFENGTVDTDVECKNGSIFLNRRYHEREELIGNIINFDTLPVKESDYANIIPSVLVMMLDTLKVIGSTWYYHARFTTPMHMIQLMYELKYENYDNLFCEYYTSSDTFKLLPDTYCTNSDDDIHINWYHYGNTVLPTYGTYDRNTILKDTVFVNSGYLTEARMGLITLLKVVDDTLQGITKEVDSLELRYNMSDYNYNMEFYITFTDGETVVRHTEFNLADFYYLYGLLLYCESTEWKELLFNTKIGIYSFKTTIKDMAYRINAVAKEFYTFSGDIIDNDVYDILESVMSHAKGYKKSLGSSQVIVEEKEVKEVNTEVVDPVVEVLTKYSNEVDVKYIARVLSNEFMLNGYDYIVVKDDKMKVYSTDGSKCQVIAKPLHRFFYNADTIDKLPLLYYLID